MCLLKAEDQERKCIIQFWDSKAKLKLAPAILPSVLYEALTPSLHLQVKPQLSSLYNVWHFLPYDDAIPILTERYEHGLYISDWRLTDLSKPLFDIWSLRFLFCDPYLLRFSYEELSKAFLTEEVARTLNRLLRYYSDVLVGLASGLPFTLFKDSIKYAVTLEMEDTGGSKYLYLPEIVIFFLIPKFLREFIDLFPESLDDPLFTQFFRWAKIPDSVFLEKIL